MALGSMDFRYGYYDKNGYWQRTKHCFVSCGARCQCSPPGGVYQLTGEALDEHREELVKRELTFAEFRSHNHD